MLASLRVLLLAVLASKATAFLPASAHLARRQAVAFAPAPSPTAAQVTLFFRWQLLTQTNLCGKQKKKAFHHDYRLYFTVAFTLASTMYPYLSIWDGKEQPPLPRPCCFHEFSTCSRSCPQWRALECD